MRFLLDTSTFLWIVADDLDRLSNDARKIIEGDGRLLYLSSASLWEIAIKYSLKKLPLNLPPDEMTVKLQETKEVLPLDINLEHAAAVANLPFHHKDPFDRLLIAQARIEDLPILTPDPNFGRYGVEVVW